MKHISIFLAVSLLYSACSHTPPIPPTAETQADKVLSRIDGLEKRPEWLTESEPFKIQNGKVMSLGQATIPADNRIEAAFRIAENNGKAAVSGAIEQRLDFVFQNTEEGTGLDSSQARYIGAEASEITTSSLRISKRYWEKIATSRDDTSRVTQYKVFALVEMPEADFKRAILDAVRKQQGKGGLSKDFAEKVDQHWDKFVGASPERNVASENK